MSNIVEFTGAVTANQINDAIGGFLQDPPDSDFQRGYLSALLCIYREILGRGADDERIARAEAMCMTPEKPVNSILRFPPRPA